MSTNDTDTTATDGQIPDRYAPDPWVDAAATTNKRGTSRPSAKVPVIPLRDWLRVEPPTTLSVAPKSPDAVKIGYDVPAMLGEFQISHDTSTSADYPRATLPVEPLSYLDIEPGDRVRYERDTDRQIVARRVEDDA